ncbi:MAG TPA: hypothetical protein VMS76_10505, partial [Planctomycetota bacterium]|nr:hypothetical protein [Planctomycetota bacterium]
LDARRGPTPVEIATAALHRTPRASAAHFAQVERQWIQGAATRRYGGLKPAGARPDGRARRSTRPFEVDT